MFSVNDYKFKANEFFVGKNPYFVDPRMRYRGSHPIKPRMGYDVCTECATPDLHEVPYGRWCLPNYFREKWSKYYKALFEQVLSKICKQYLFFWIMSYPSHENARVLMKVRPDMNYRPYY